MNENKIIVNYPLIKTFINPSIYSNILQHIEKLIPKIIVNAMLEETIPIYGDGKNIRDWIYVEDHINAIFALHKKNIISEVFNIGGNNERANIDLTYLIINQLNKNIRMSYEIS